MLETAQAQCCRFAVHTPNDVCVSVRAYLYINRDTSSTYTDMGSVLQMNYDSFTFHTVVDVIDFVLRACMPYAVYNHIGQSVSHIQKIINLIFGAYTRPDESARRGTDLCHNRPGKKLKIAKIFVFVFYFTFSSLLQFLLSVF